MNARGGLAVSKKILKKKEKKRKSESKGKGTATAVKSEKHETRGDRCFVLLFSFNRPRRKIFSFSWWQKLCHVS